MATYKRIMVFGKPGSGKSTFAFQLHQATQIPLFHLDKYFFITNWQERDHQDFLAIQQTMVEQDTWIIDGNSLQSLALRYQKADLVLYFSYPTWLCYLRILKRWWYKDPTIDDRAAGCRETLNLK